ncbi:DUF87 domain-containing protein [Pyruvatibacter sp. HU-CL02332]|uniref:ATP-binding protein n=1 Tax=Pyruvatibacter sp. HU-CL02332 TaxID=3127650 RepID=UPI0033659B91
MMDLSDVASANASIDFARWTGVFFAMLVVIASLVALFTNEHLPGSTTASAAFKLVSVVGNPVPLFSIPALVSIAAAYQNDVIQPVVLSFIWIALVVARPIERAASVLAWWFDAVSQNQDLTSVGLIDRIDDPNIVRVRMKSGASWVPNRLYTAALPNGSQRFVIALFEQLQGANVVGTGLVVARPGDDPLPIQEGHVCATHDDEKTSDFLSDLSGMKDARLVGFVVEGSMIESIRFEVSASSELEEGHLIFANVQGRQVFYQITDAETSEESFDQNPRGTHIASATQVGIYTEDTGFTKFAWLPKMNSPLFAAANAKLMPQVLSADEFRVARVPSTDIHVSANAADLVDYHSAVLGITGTGKTELALDLIGEVLARDTKVFCVDLTGEYRHRLTAFSPTFPSVPAAKVADFEKKIFDAETGDYGGGKEKKILQTFVEGVRTDVTSEIESFLTSPNEQLAILELNEIANTKASLRITELYLSAIMAWARTNRGSSRTLVVLEEAHTIVPEVFGSGLGREEQNVVSRIGQIALQGRKYQVGLMLISQRTALVSKTILSQCNTFFTHSLIDQTSLAFLESVYSKRHVRLIPNLRPREFLAFGKALKVERPILLRKDYEPTKEAASKALSSSATFSKSTN